MKWFLLLLIVFSLMYASPVPAQAQIDGATVRVSSPEVAEPKAVRFAWSESAQPNFFNQAGLPAVPFRTDKPAPSARQYALDTPNTGK